MRLFYRTGWSALVLSIAAVAATLSAASQATNQQGISSQSTAVFCVQGRVISSTGRAEADATVLLEETGQPALKTRSDEAGKFTFSGLHPGTYLIHAEKPGWHSRTAEVRTSQEKQDPFELRLESAETNSGDPINSAEAMEFSDQPNFSIAGVTDWTAVGGHGSDSILRTSEALARDTLALQSQDREKKQPGMEGVSVEAKAEEARLRAALAAAPAAFEANRKLGEFYLRIAKFKESIPFLQNASRIDPTNHMVEYELAAAFKESGDFLQAREHIQRLLAVEPNADLHRMGGEVAEKLGDSLVAVHEFENAVHLDPSEQNYFEWGSELLLHRAVWQAQEVFEKGANAYPRSARMLTGKGAALFAGALYEKSAQSLCDASDLDKADLEPYLFMGKVEMAAPNPLPCIEQKLARFVSDEPGNAMANYLYAMAIWKRQQQPANPEAREQVIRLLNSAVKIDPKCSDAYLQLGVIYSSQRDLETAISFYKKAIEANPQLGEAHYRLGVAYDREGEPAKAKLEFQQHDELERLQAAVIEQQRREVKQFLVVNPAKDQVSH